MKYKYIILILLIFLITYIILTSVFFNYGESGYMVVPTMNYSDRKIKVLTFNIHHGKGLDGVIDLDKIASIIKVYEPDLVGLNEVDLYLPRSGMINQIRYLGQQTGLNYYFAAAWRVGPGQYGNGLLSRLPILNPVSIELPRFMNREPRVLFQFDTIIDGKEVMIMITHLGLNPVEKERQLKFLAEKINIIKKPLMVMGDFNLTPGAAVMRDFLKNTGLKCSLKEPTYPADEPDLKIDYILISEHWEVLEARVVLTTASDHLPLMGVFKLKDDF